MPVNFLTKQSKKVRSTTSKKEKASSKVGPLGQDDRHSLDQSFLKVRNHFFVLDIEKYSKRLTLGAFNNHRIKEADIAKLIKSFRERYDAHLPRNALYVLLKPDWIANWGEGKTAEEVRVQRLDQLPELKLSQSGEEAMRNGQVLLLAGQHRLQAATTLIAQIRRKTEELREAAGNPESCSEQVKEWTDEIKRLDDFVKKHSVGRWLVEVMDQGEHFFFTVRLPCSLET